MNPLVTSAILSVLRYAITWCGGAVILSSHGDQVEILAGVRISGGVIDLDDVLEVVIDVAPRLGPHADGMGPAG